MEHHGNLLITGATGFIGFKVLLDALHAGWKVRITSRTLEKVEKLLNNEQIKPFAETIEITIVPSILKEGAYNEALQGISHVIHTATPLPFPTDHPARDIIEPAVQGTKTLLHDALGITGLKRVVVTSSLVSNIPYPPPDTASSTASDRVPDPSAEELAADLDFFTAYRYSKILSLNSIDAFRLTMAPRFDIVNVIPGFVHGANLLATADTVLGGSNRLLLATLLGQNLPPPRLAGAAHVDDVAKVHICALSEQVVPFQSNIDLAISQPVVYNDAWKIVEGAFPKAVASGVLQQGSQPSLKVNYDAADTLRRCKIEMKTYSQMVEDTVRQYLELTGNIRA